ncbi:MAG: hypothetical protein KAJ49_07980 [Arcobacteraceae bacterium]|nr:hypothetical protein [Arcobacteraceae bacterium]
MSIIGLVFYQSISANTLPIKKQDVSPEQLKKQNKEITILAAEQLSKDLPKEIDKYTTCTNIKASGATLIYIFEINTGAKSDKAVIKEDKQRMENGVTYGVCHSSKRFMDAQIMITYIYKSASSKAKLFQFDITQDKCFKLYGSK